MTIGEYEFKWGVSETPGFTVKPSMSWAYQLNISEGGCHPDDPVEVNDSDPSYFFIKKSERIVIVSWVF